MRTIQRQIASALIFSSDNKLFMGKKDPKKGGVYSDCWHIPGGGVDDSEDYLEALLREIKEETELNIKQDAVELVDNTGTGGSEKTLKESNETVMC
jgi:ADP-ribose pyrophosphatase YjhB (NUDIX family)